MGDMVFLMLLGGAEKNLLNGMQMDVCDVTNLLMVSGLSRANTQLLRVVFRYGALCYCDDGKG